MLSRSIVLGLALVLAAAAATQAQPAPGDMNCDGAKDGLDIAPFVLALTDPSEYQAEYPYCQLSNADFDCDGGVGTGDIAGFVQCLLTGSSFPCIPPDMVLIPASEFQMGDSWNEGSAGERPVHTVSLNQYYLDPYEVTNQQYVDGLNWAWAHGGLITVTGGVVYKYNSGTSYPYCDTTAKSIFSRITWNGSTFGAVSGKESHPVVQVTWYGAAAYANWRSALQGKPLCYDLSSWTCNFGRGYRLPTEAEWEKAARGGSDGHRFPWSYDENIQQDRANYQCYCPSGVRFYSYDAGPTCGFNPAFSSGPTPYTSPVGYFGPNDYGLFDMAGNVVEWCNDGYDGTYYSSSPSNNPHGPVVGDGYRVLRGGSWALDADHCRCAYRSFNTPGYRFSGGGFRCVLGIP